MDFPSFLLRCIPRPFHWFIPTFCPISDRFTPNPGPIAHWATSTPCPIADWFEQRLRRLMNETGVDGFKFDAGEGEFAPLRLVPQPTVYAGRWARFAARFGGGGEVRSAHESQDAASELIV